MNSIVYAPIVKYPVISTSDRYFMGGSKADCTGQGIGTDLAPYFKAAWDYGVQRYKNGFKISVPSGPYRWTTPIVLNGLGARNVTVEFEGQITPDAIAMRCCTFTNLYKFSLQAKIDRGGRFAGYNQPSPFYVNYSTNSDVVSGGGQIMFVIDGVFDYDLDLSAYGYAGRLLHITDSQINGNPPTGAIKGRIKTSRDADLSKARVPQALWADPGTNAGQGNFGNLDLLNEDFGVWGSVFQDWNDIKINEVDGACAYGGLEFRGCVVVSLPSIYVGDLDSRSPTAWHLSFIPSNSRSCGNIYCGDIKFLNDGGGILVSNGVGYFNLGTINHISQDSHPHGTVLRIDNTPNVTANLVVDHDGGAVYYVTGSKSKNQKIDFLVTAVHSTNTILIDSSVQGFLKLSGLISGVTGGYSCLVSQSSAYTDLTSFNLLKGTGSHISISANNKVVWISGSYDGPLAYGNSNTLSYINNNQVISL